MRSHPDHGLALREPELPGLPGLLDAPDLAARAGLAGLRGSYLLYKPWTSCIAGLMPEDGSLDAWMAATYPAQRYDEIRARPAWQESVIFFDEAQTVLVPLARLRKPRAARALASPDTRAELLSRVGLEDCVLTLLRFKPGRRLVLRADGPTGARAVLKLHARKSDYARALAGARQGAAGGVRLIGACAEHGAIATEWVPGRALTAHAPLDSFVRMGGALAAAHARAPASDLPKLRASDPQQIAEEIGWLLPGLETTARDVAARLPAPPWDVPVALHGDFSADQVVEGPTGARIVDWDRACLGPAARDLGSALAALDLDGLRGVDTAEAAGDALIAGYGAAGGTVSESDVCTWRAHALLGRATEGFRMRRPGWEVEAKAAVTRVGALLDGASRPTPHLAEALALRTVANGAPTLLRLKPRRRALIRYGDAVLGKLRTKGPDTEAVHIQTGLRDAGLDGRHGVAVPRVLGAFMDPPVWLQEEVVGTPLGALIESADVQVAMRRTGRALATLHNAPPQTARLWTLSDELAVLKRAVGSGPHSELANLAAKKLAGLDAAPEVGLHRDFYFDQVIVAPETIWLIDLDLHAWGDAAIDLGNFLAHLTEFDLRSGGDGSGLASLGDVLLAGYAQKRALPDAARIDLMHWVSLARHVSIARRFSDRAHAVPAIAALCRNRLDSYASQPMQDAV